jgi:2-oxo-3-hexenedioate decarboxylase
VAALDPGTLARELAAAYASRRMIAVPPSARDSGFDLSAAYAVEAEFTRLRQSAGRTTVGRKVGFANRAMWRVLKLDTLLWAHMYDDTVHYVEHGTASLPIARMYSPRIEPEIVFRLRKPLGVSESEPAAVLEAVDWLALGFEIIDCVFPEWKCQPVDFVASFGLHAALVVGEPRRIEAAMIPALVDELTRFTVRLMKNGELVEEGSGRNVLRSPALCLGELAAAVARQPQAEALAAGEVISSGTLTTSHPIKPGETWSAAVDGIDLPGLSIYIP